MGYLNYAEERSKAVSVEVQRMMDNDPGNVSLLKVKAIAEEELRTIEEFKKILSADPETLSKKERHFRKMVKALDHFKVQEKVL